MRKIVAVVFFCFVAYLAAAQISVGTANVGIHTGSGTPVHATVYSTGQPIHSWHIIDGGEKVLIAGGARKANGGKFKKKGTIGCYDLENGANIWSGNINYKWHKPQFYDSLLIIEDNSSRFIKSYYDPFTGGLLHESQDHVLGMLPDGNILRWNRGQVHGLLSSVQPDGGVSWERPCEGRKVPSEYFISGDSTLIVIAEGIYSMDLRTGIGWHYPSSTTVANRNSVKSAWALRLNNYDINYFAGEVVWSINPLSPSVEGVYTNVYEDGDYFYWASAGKLVCLESASGCAVWEVPVSAGEASAGTVFVTEERLYHFNYGSAKQERHNYRFGEPYISVYDSATGEQVSKHSTGERILSFVVDYENRTAYIICEDGLYPYLLEEGRMGDPLLFKEDLGTESIPFYVRGDAIIKHPEGKDFHFLYQIYPSDSFLLALGGDKCWVVSGNNMEVLDEIAWDRLLVPHKMTGSHIIASESDATHFLDIGQKSAARIRAGHDARYQGKYMFWSEGDRIFRLDLGEFMPEIEGDDGILDYGEDIDEKMTIY